METLAQRVESCLEAVMKDKKVDRATVINAVALSCGIKAPSVYDWANGSTKNLTGLNLLKAAEFFGVNPIWLQTGKGRRIQPQAQEPAVDYQIGVTEDKYVLVDLLANPLGAGNGGDLLEFDEVEGRRAYRRDWIEKNGFRLKALKLLPVEGDSMVPYVFHGNHVLINTDDKRVVDGEHYGIRTGGRNKVKRLFTQVDGKIRIESYNAAPEYVEKKGDLEVLGLVVDRNGTSRGRRP